MDHNFKKNLKRIIWGNGYSNDERVRMGMDQAGNYSYVLLSFLLFSGMVIGLLFNKFDIAFFATILFLISGIFNLVFLIKKGSFSQNESSHKRMKKIFAYPLGVIVYSGIQFFFKIRAVDMPSQKDILSLILYSLISGIIWLILFLFLMRLVTRKSDKQIEKKINKEL